MGLFSFVGKALKGVAKVASVVPGVGSLVGGIAGTVGNLLDAKKPMAATKYLTLAQAVAKRRAAGHIPVLRGKSPGFMPTPRVASASPVMPGGALATPSGIVASISATPPAGYAGSARAPVKRKRKKAKKKVGTRRRSGARKLKFGSKAWRAKYMKKRRR